MIEELFTFQKFQDKESLEEFTTILSEQNMYFVIEEFSNNLGSTFPLAEQQNAYHVKLKKEDFKKAYKILLEISSQQLENVDKDYYLFEFTDIELIEIVTKPDEWSQFDYILAQKLLKDRGKEIKPEVAEVIKNQRIQELGKPDEGQRSWIILGYMSSFLGGLLGIFIGWHLRYHKKTLPNGDSVYGYTPSDRNHGYNIFIIGIVFFFLWLIYPFYILINN